MSQDPYSPYVMQVSKRDREIYHQVVIACRKQREVAAEFKISQARVSKIVARVALWLSQTAPCGLEEVPRPQRLYTVARTYVAKLKYYEQRALACFDESERREQTTQTFDLVENPNGKGYVRANGKLKVLPPKADLKYLEAARRYHTMMVEFDGFAANGQVDTSNTGRLREVPLMTDPEVEDGIIAIAARLVEERRQKAEVGRQKEEVGRQKEEAEESGGVGDVAEVAKSVAESPVEYSPDGALSENEEEVGLEREIAGANEFRQPLSAAEETVAMVAPSGIAPSPLYSGERVGVRGLNWVQAQRGHSTLSEALPKPARVPASAPHPIPLPGVPRRGDQKIPPTPAGYFRDGRFARPIPVMRSGFRESPHKRPFLRVSPPKLYELNELTNEWEVAR